MASKGLFSINEFANFSRTTRDALIHYDKIDLLKPAARGKSGYRYYSAGQIPLVKVIHTLQELGMTLEEIRAISHNLSPGLVSELFEKADEKIDEKIKDWISVQKLLFALRKMMQSAVDIDEEAITVQFMPAEAIVLGEINDYSQGKNDWDALHIFYHKMRERYPSMNLNYPVWGRFAEARIKQGDWIWPSRFYFYNPEGRDRKPAGLYAIGYARGGYGQCTSLYKRIIAHIEANELEIAGDAYEEYPLNEICVSDSTNYLIRVMIMVRAKELSLPD